MTRKGIAETLPGHPIYLVDGMRTPQLKARGVPGPFPASDLAVAAGRALLLRQPFSPQDLDEVIRAVSPRGPTRPTSPGWWPCAWAAGPRSRPGRCSATVPPACRPSTARPRTSRSGAPTWSWPAAPRP